MKKLCFALPVLVLALFLAACGKTPDQELMSKVPASANGLFLFDGTNATKTKMYADNKKMFLEEVKKAKLPEDILQCRVLFFGSVKEEWGGFLIQSANQQVGKFFDYTLADIKKNNKDTVKDLKEVKVGSERHVTATVEGHKVIAILYHENLLLVGINKTDPAFFNADKPNPIFKDIQMQNMLLSSAIKVVLPDQPGKAKESVDTVTQMLPALKKLEAIALNIPFSEDDPVLDFRMIFKDEPAAGEMMAAANMGIGFATQAGPEYAEFAQKVTRKTEKNIFSLSFKIKDAEELGKKIEASKKKREQERAARQAALKAKAQQNAKKAAVPAKPAPKAIAPAKPAQPAPKAVAPAKPAQPAPKAVAPAKPAQPAQPAPKAVAPAKPAQPAQPAPKAAAPAKPAPSATKADAAQK